MKNRRKQRNEKATCSEKVMIRFRGKKEHKRGTENNTCQETT
jgi:hypothetical protein